MILKINDKEYEVRFGIGFVRELDKKYNVTYIAGQKMGYGIEATVPLLLGGSATVLSDLLYAGTVNCKERPTPKEIDEYIDSVENYDAFVEQVLDELKKQNATKTRVAELIKKHEEAKAQEEQKATPKVNPTPTGPKMPITK